MTPTVDTEPFHISDEMKMLISYRPNLFSIGRIDKVAAEVSANSQLIGKTALRP